MEPSATAYEETVRPEWIDDNDHMNLAYYVLVFTDAAEAFSAQMGLPPGGRVTQMHTAYEREVNRGDRLRVTTHVLGLNGAELHLLHEMVHAGEKYRAATLEMVVTHEQDFPAEARDRLRSMLANPAPPASGRRIGMARAS